jgi:hypothetical protein
MTQCCFVALREPHSVLLQFRGDAADEAALIDATVTRLSTHFEQARYFYNRDVPLRGAACVDELRDCVCNADDVLDTLRRCSPDLAVDAAECDTRARAVPLAAAASAAAVVGGAVAGAPGDAWLSLLAKLLVHRTVSDADAAVLRSAHVVDALQRAFRRRLVECRRVVLADCVEVLLRVQTRLDDDFLAALNRVVQRESAGRCAVQLMPLCRGWSPELSDAVSLRLAVSAELGLVELSPRPGGQLAVAAVLLIEPSAAALGFEPLCVTVRDKQQQQQQAEASDADDVRGKRKAKKAKKEKAPKAAEAEAAEKSSRCQIQ